MRTLNVAIVLHQRKGHRVIGKRCDRASTLAMMPADIKFVERERARQNILGSYNSFISVAFQKELPAQEISLWISVQPCHFRSRKAHREHFNTIRLRRKANGQSRKVHP